MFICFGEIGVAIRLKNRHNTHALHDLHLSEFSRPGVSLVLPELEAAIRFRLHPNWWILFTF
jgi:hypothetical protein